MSRTESTRQPLRIRNFPLGPNPWRIDWFGAIAFPDRESRWTQPSLQVHLSSTAATSSLIADPPLAHPASRRATRECWVSVGTLPLLRAGDLWADGVLISQPEYQVETFQNLLIDASTSSIIKAGSATEPGKFLIPFRDHPGHMGGTQANCAVVALTDGRRLLVPCMELIRFYFGSSSSLLSRIFTPLFEKEHLFSRLVRSTSGARMELDLAEGIPGASAEDVGRIAGSQRAWRAAKSVSTSCARALAAGQHAYPVSHFPFEGRTDLVASGQWVGDERQTFLVYHLRSCSHPFPFRSLKYSVPPREKKEPKQARNGVDDALRLSPKAPRSSTLQELDASRKLAPSNRTVSPRRRFPDLEGKGVWASKAVTPTPTTRTLPGEPVSDYAVGDQISSTRVRPVEINELKAVESVPGFLRDLMPALAQLQDVQLTLLTASAHDGWTIPLPPRHPDHSTSEHSFEHVAAFHLQHPSGNWLVVAAEGDSLRVLLSPAPSAPDTNSIEVILAAVETYAENGGDQNTADLALDLQHTEWASLQISTWIQEHFS